MFKIKKVRPMFTGIITTATTYKLDQTTSESGLLLDVTRRKGDLNIYQRVVSVGSMVKDLKEGDIVRINFKRYAKPVHLPGALENNIQKDKMQMSYEIPTISLDGEDYLFLQNNDIELVVEEAEIDDGGLLE